MKIEKVESDTWFSRVPMAEGEINGERFVLSLLADASALLLEFPYARYLIKTTDIIEEALKEFYETDSTVDRSR